MIARVAINEGRSFFCIRQETEGGYACEHTDVRNEARAGEIAAEWCGDLGFTTYDFWHGTEVPGVFRVTVVDAGSGAVLEERVVTCVSE